MDKKKIDVQENVIDTENFLPEENNVKITYRAEETETENNADEEILSRKDIKSNHRRRVRTYAYRYGHNHSKRCGCCCKNL